MNEKRTQKEPTGGHLLPKRLALIALLIAAAVILSSCYVNEQDRILGDGTGVGGGATQTFESVVTPTPTATATPTLAPDSTDSSQVDWSNWNWDNNSPTDPPNNVIPVDGSTTAPTGGSATVGLPTAAPTIGTVSSDVLKDGSEGTAVKQLQQRLKDLGYYTGSVDGKFGKGTAASVKDFQAANNLTADGIAGKGTLQAINGNNAIAKKDAKTGSTGNTTTSKPSATSAPSSNTSVPKDAKTDIYLRLGSSGTQVKYLQNRLIALGYLSGSADGDFGETTEAAVVEFQKKNSIYSDGIAGPTTLTKLYSSSAKKASSVVANIGSLKRGMSGSGVKALQQQLKSLGYYSGSVDGDFGEGTELAVRAFQSANNLTADGVAGKSTMNAIYAANSTTSHDTVISGTKPETYGAKVTINGYTTISTSSGTSKNNVTSLQNMLQSRNYYTGTVDGSYGSGTEAAVKAYQQAAGLRVTGMAGPSTQRLLYGGTAESGSYTKLQVGSKGTAVKNLQYTLYELKYYDGDITGTYDESTKNAVMNFQQVNGLTVDGVAGQDTQRRLYSSNAIPCNI